MTCIGFLLTLVSRGLAQPETLRQPTMELELQKLNSEEAKCDESTTTEVKASEAGKQSKELSRGRGVITVVTNLICYTFLNVAISMIAPFYPIVVSLICHCKIEWLLNCC